MHALQPALEVEYGSFVSSMRNVLFDPKVSPGRGVQGTPPEDEDLFGHSWPDWSHLSADSEWPDLLMEHSGARVI
jgi:hypothetical protein